MRLIGCQKLAAVVLLVISASRLPAVEHEYMARDLVTFHQDKVVPGLGFRMEDFFQWNDETLEAKHDYIQWVFPNQKRSAYNQTAPALDPKTAEELRSSKAAMQQIDNAFQRMLTFYGFALQKNGTVVRAANFAEKSGWITVNNHNYLRITRIMIFLREVGLDDRAKEFFCALNAIYDDNPAPIGPHTFRIWSEAAGVAVRTASPQ